MENQTVEIKTFDISDENFSYQEQDNISQLIDIIKSLNIREIEPYLMEGDLTNESIGSNKYFFLSVLRDIFIKFKNLGDNSLTYFKSRCYSSMCQNNHDKIVHAFEGNNSKSQFGFIPVEADDSEKLGLHFCFFFNGKNGEKTNNSCTFMLDAALKYGEFKDKGIDC